MNDKTLIRHEKHGDYILHPGKHQGKTYYDATYVSKRNPHKQHVLTKNYPSLDAAMTIADEHHKKMNKSKKRKKKGLLSKIRKIIGI